MESIKVEIKGHLGIKINSPKEENPILNCSAKERMF